MIAGRGEQGRRRGSSSSNPGGTSSFVSPETWQVEPSASNHQQVSEIKWLLSSQSSPLRPRLPPIPPELTSGILDQAGYHSVRKVVREESVVFRNNANELYLRTPPLDSFLELGCLRKVEITLVSHDQGYSGEPQHMKGTYEGSYTWFELSLDRPRKQALQDDPREEGGDQTCRGATPRSDDEGSENGADGSESEPAEWEEVARCRIQSNVHASWSYKEHTITLGPDDPLIKQANRGDSLGIWARTLYPAWENHVKKAEIRIWQPQF
ncbi:hypothetical protein IE53DRAFT_386026 [Violaceomyces palustris]|uniref:Uncharacterized protein n=1 Tax=Violaceomyces palustris TaxID=1673888 RepID=A0ACD0P0H5_9BASI|nr:hypothetical protein IE53DRAFT_386026 [Violaceomyces palustris]